MIQEICDLKYCKIRQRHHTDDFRTCNSDPFINDEDESHCIIRFCNKHAEEYKSVQKLDNLEGLDIHFKEKKHHR